MIARTAPDTFAVKRGVLDFRSELEIKLPLGDSGLWLRDVVAKEDEVTELKELLELEQKSQNPDQSYVVRLELRLANALNAVGKDEEALPIVLSVVNSARETGNEILLAESLSTYGTILNELGQVENALKASEEANQIYRKLADAQPNAYLPDLAMSLNNLGRDYSNLGRLEDALKASEEANCIYEKFVEAQPNAYLPNLAMLLSNLGGDYASLGRLEDALKASEEANQIYQKLGDVQPNAYLPDLADSLNKLGNRYNSLGRLEDALKVVIESLSITKPFFKTFPTAFARDTTQRIENYFSILQKLEQQPDPELLRGFEPILETLEIKT